MRDEIKIHIATEDEAKLWDDYVVSHPEATHCHLYCWKKIIEESYNQKGYYFIAKQEGQIVGILPSIHIQSRIFSTSLVSMPYLSYGGILATHQNAAQHLFTSAFAKAKKLNVNTLELRNRQQCCINYTKDNEQIRKVRMVKTLPSSATELSQSFPSKLRSQIKRPVKEGMTFQIGGIELLDSFYDVFTVNMRDLGSPVHRKSIFCNLMEGLPGQVKIGVVSYRNSAVASGIIISFNDEVEIPWASSLRSYNKLSPNMLLYYSFLEYCCNRNIKKFDFGRSTPGEGTYRFKKQWGATPEPLVWKTCPTTHTVNYNELDQHFTKNKKTSKTMDILVEVWKKLPVSVANKLGPLIRGDISN